MRNYIFSLIAILLLSTISITAFGQSAEPKPVEPKAAEPNITLQTDKTSYVISDTIVVSGAVKSIVEGTQITYQIFDPDKNQVDIGQIDVAKDGKYAFTVKPGKLWKKDGTYTVKVQYGLPNVVAETNFEFRGTKKQITDIFEVKDPSGSGTFDVKYSINGGTIKGMTLDVQGLSLIVSINATDGGSITLESPRALIDAKSTNGDDDSFIILIDGAEINQQKEEKSSESRTLTVQFWQGDSDIEIIGTQIVPEFGTIAALVLAIAIISIIAVSAKTRLRLMPKY